MSKSPRGRRARHPSLAALVVAVALAGCGPLRVSQDGRFVIGGELSKGNFDASSPRVKKADAQIAALLGHPLSFYFDAALVPKWADDFQALSTIAIEIAADSLAKLRSRNPDMFAWCAPRLLRIEWDYSATNEYTKHDFDPKTGILRIVLTSRNENQDQDDAIRFSIGRAYSDSLTQSVAAKDPAAMSSVEERRAYASYLIDFGYGRESSRGPKTRDDEHLDPPRCRVTLDVLRALAAWKGRSPDEEARLTHYLMEESRHFAYVRNAYFEEAERAPESSDYRRAEAAFVTWLNASFDALTSSEEERILEEVHNSINKGAPRAYPGFDYAGLWQRTLPRWASAGHPTSAENDADRDRQRVFDAVIAPVRFSRDDDSGCGSRGAPTYAAMAQDTALRDRLFASVLAMRDVDVTKVVAANLMSMKSADTALAFLRAAESDAPEFRAVLRTISTYAGHCSHEAEIFDELPRLWKSHPSPRERGVIVFALRHFGTRRDTFSRWFGPLTREEFEAYLDEEPDPLRQVHYLWPLLGKGYSHGAPMIARLDTWLTDDFRKRESWWPESLRTLASDLCAEHAADDLAKLHAYVESRISAHPSEASALEPALDRSAKGGCPKSVSE